jgi:predicted RNA-binding Zn-ribbon protein involved in translation (DUF1610 family)
VVDEAALIDDEVWYRYLRPTLTDVKGQAIIISTPKGKNWFWEMFCRGRDPEYTDYMSWQYPTSLNPYLPDDEIENARKELPELVFRQEYLAEFLDDANSFFRNVEKCILPGSGEQIDEDELADDITEEKYECPDCGHIFIIRTENCRQNNNYLGEEDRYICCKMCKYKILRKNRINSAYYTGVDLGQSIDFTVIATVRYKPGEKLRLVNIDRFNQISWVVQKDRIRAAHKKFNGIIAMDGTGLGAPLVDDLIFDGLPVDGVKFTNELKLKMFSKLAVLFEREMIEIPDNKALKDELRAFQTERTPTGNWKLGAPSNMHDDMVTALALAVWVTPMLECNTEDTPN